MKIKLLSDLHLEFYKSTQVDPRLLESEDVDVLVLAGDIAVGFNNVVDALDQFSEAYREVVYLPGNHEYYGKDIHELDDLPYAVKCNIHIINPGIFRLNDVTFIGASLWTNFHNDPMAMLAAGDMISDFRVIKGFKPEDAVGLFNYHSEYIKMMYENIPGKKVIVTHFLPADACTHPRFIGENLLNKYFANSMDAWISGLSNTTWMFGHTHEAMDFMLGDTRMVCNPQGYPHEYNKFNYNKVVEV